ncbi:hypothetical protein GRI40_01205 [Altererythrobacter aerius]|uniref:Uncharacterized protein n=1 Tax=Tsuneonella aeria TaxID=1837929 RepID=A0A6I4T938_9SPHN|nr:hypothetical protein [Tsuneonella aeria]MXO73841.1 hypothetical protein [Tsuneonella aeria]
MTSPEPLDTFREPTDGPSFRDIAVAAIAGLALLFGIGLLAGLAVAASEGAIRNPARAATGLAIAVLLVAGCGWALWRVGRKLTGGIMSPRQRTARRMVILSMAIGAVLGAALQISALDGDPLAISTGPVPPFAALVTIAVFLTAVPAVSWRWWRSIDEHEALSYKDGALVAVYAYSAIAPTWWMAWRGGFLPEPHYMATFLIVMAVWAAVWGLRRFS